ncbi:hypothetical protein ACF0H5_016934 [Mactra antiquata]
MPSAHYWVSLIIMTYFVSTIKCQETTCGHVPTPDNGYRFNEPTYEVGTFIVFRCNEGYERTGLPKLLCRSDGQWNPETAPTCTIRDCGEFGEVLNGETFQDNTFVERNKYGSVVEVTCYNGYVLNGNSEVKCQSNGQWEDKPTCLQTTCAPYPGLNDSRCILKTRYSNFRLFMVCRNDDIVSGTKVGSRYSQCDNHEWNNLDMACICNCKIPEFPPNTIEVKNLDENRFLSHGQILDYSCSVDTIKTISKDQSIICENGNSMIQSPNKEDIVLSLFNQAFNETELCNTVDKNGDKRTSNLGHNSGCSIVTDLILLLFVSFVLIAI